MKHKLLLTTLAFAVTPLLLSSERRGTEISFGVASGSTLTKTFEVETAFTLDNFDMMMNGQAPPMVPEMSMDILSVSTMVYEDTYNKVADGRPTSLTRSFETLVGEGEVAMEIDIMGEIQSESQTIEMSSILEGESVKFSWDGDAYEVALSDNSSLEEEDIDGLLEDTDFRSLLPEEEVDEGDEWEIEIGKLQAILAPGGDTKLVPEEMDEEASSMLGGGDMGDLNDYFNEDLEGEFVATFDGLEKDSGLAVIKFTFELSNAVDLTEKTRESLEDAELPEGVGEMEVEHVDIEVAYEGEGILLWDLKAGHFQSFEASGEFEMLMDQGMLIEAMGQEMSIEQTMEFSGSLAYSVGVE